MGGGRSPWAVLNLETRSLTDEHRLERVWKSSKFMSRLRARADTARSSSRQNRIVKDFAFFAVMAALILTTTYHAVMQRGCI